MKILKSLNPKKMKKRDNSMLLALLLLGGAAALLLFSLLPDRNSGSEVVYSKNFEDKVNRHLMFTQEKMELQRQRMIIENRALAPDYDSTKPEKLYQASANNIDTPSETHADDVAKELGRVETETKTPTPHELIQTELFNQQQSKEYTAAYKEEYARQFIANAARSGWDVKLGDDFRVLSVTPIRNPSNQMNLFHSNGKSAQ